MLCVALHKDAASRACEAFRERRASKTYLAVLEGIVDAEAVPCREEEPIGWGEGVDGRNASGRKRKPHAVQHTPAHGFFQRKKVYLMMPEYRSRVFRASGVMFLSVNRRLIEAKQNYFCFGHRSRFSLYACQSIPRCQAKSAGLLASPALGVHKSPRYPSN